ncbi:MAG: trypsin-like peptidase domain-containing protein [Tetrasphaera sp.]
MLGGLASFPSAPRAAIEQAPARQLLPTPTAPGANQSTPTPDGTAAVEAAELDAAEQRIVALYDRVAPSVVNITTRVLRRDFFYNVLPQEGAGSGFVLDTVGHILTNYHVIADAEYIEVSFGDQLVVAATVVGADQRNDVAVLKVDAPADVLKPVELGSSQNLRCRPVGHRHRQPLRPVQPHADNGRHQRAQPHAGRTGQPSDQRRHPDRRRHQPGQLRRATARLSGRVIGINSAIFSPTGASAGVGFAVPIDTIKRMLPDLLTLGRYRHPWLGVRYGYNLTPGLTEVLKLPVSAGVLLVQLYRGSPLDQVGVAGAQQETIVGNQRVYTGGDILVVLDDIPLRSLEQLEALVESEYVVGAEVTLTLLRNGQEMQVTFTLVEEPGS